MVPVAFHWMESLPLTDSGKVDRKALAALRREDDVSEADGHAPRTPTERRLAHAWADVLGTRVDRIRRRDGFFDRGGTSLSAVKLVMTLDGALSLKDATRHPILADQAALIDERSPRLSRVADSGRST
jgi:hypothetical protein